MQENRIYKLCIAIFLTITSFTYVQATDDAKESSKQKSLGYYSLMYISENKPNVPAAQQKKMWKYKFAAKNIFAGNAVKENKKFSERNILIFTLEVDKNQKYSKEEGKIHITLYTSPRANSVYHYAQLYPDDSVPLPSGMTLKDQKSAASISFKGILLSKYKNLASKIQVLKDQAGPELYSSALQGSEALQNSSALQALVNSDASILRSKTSVALVEELDTLETGYRTIWATLHTEEKKKMTEELAKIKAQLAEGNFSSLDFDGASSPGTWIETAIKKTDATFEQTSSKKERKGILSKLDEDVKRAQSQLSQSQGH